MLEKPYSPEKSPTALTETLQPREMPCSRLRAAQPTCEGVRVGGRAGIRGALTFFGAAGRQPCPPRGAGQGGVQGLGLGGHGGGWGRADLSERSAPGGREKGEALWGGGKKNSAWVVQRGPPTLKPPRSCPGTTPAPPGTCSSAHAVCQAAIRLPAPCPPLAQPGHPDSRSPRPKSPPGPPRSPYSPYNTPNCSHHPHFLPHCPQSLGAGSGGPAAASWALWGTSHRQAPVLAPQQQRGGTVPAPSPLPDTASPPAPAPSPPAPRPRAVGPLARRQG